MRQISFNQARLELIADGMDETTTNEFFAWLEPRKHIWIGFKKLALQYAETGQKRIGSKKIFEDLRYDPEIKKIGEFKMCNDYTPYFSRLFAKNYPEYANKFVFKSCKKSLAEAIPLGQTRLQYS